MSMPPVISTYLCDGAREQLMYEIPFSSNTGSAFWLHIFMKD